MTPDDFIFFARLLRRRCGLSLSADKMALAERRLAPVMRRFDLRDMAALMRELRLAPEALGEAVIEAMSVNESSFFRDPALFGRLRDTVLPRLLAARAPQRRLRLWSAGCATGQEPYSLAILLSEMGLAKAGWTLDVIATDLSADALARAEAGRYCAQEIQRGLDPEQTARYFRAAGTEWTVHDHLRRMVRFRRFNLLDSFGWLDDIDIVLCRNVLIYFDRAARVDVLTRIADTLAPDGVLLLGENEMPDSLTGAFGESADGAGIYLKSRAAIARAS